MITEDYVPFETAKLLKSKGFDEMGDIVYDMDGNLFNMLNEPFTNYECYAPTLSIALKWLRQQHGLYADIFIIDYAPDPWIANIHKYNDEIELVTVYKHDYTFFKTYEEAANFIIKKCLENFM